jgi:hypothetical protein
MTSSGDFLGVADWLLFWLLWDQEAIRLRHSGAMQSIEPGIPRFRVWCWRTIRE